MSIKCCPWPAGPPRRPPLHHPLQPTALCAPSGATLAAGKPRPWEAPPSASSLGGGVKGLSPAGLLLLPPCAAAWIGLQSSPSGLGQRVPSPPPGWGRARSHHSAGASAPQLGSPHRASQNQETDGQTGCRLQTHTPPGRASWAEKPRQSGEFPNRVYFAESSLQFQVTCVPGHWFSGSPEQVCGGEQSRLGPACLLSTSPTWGARGEAGCTRASQHHPLGSDLWPDAYFRRVCHCTNKHSSARTGSSQNEKVIPCSLNLFKDSLPLSPPERRGLGMA